MTVIQCDATECRHNESGRCMRDEITIIPGLASWLPTALDPSSSFTTGPWFPGYTGELIDYTAYAQDKPGSLSMGAICHNYAPQP